MPRDQIRGLWEKCSSGLKEWKDFPDGMHSTLIFKCIMDLCHINSLTATPWLLDDTCMQPGYFATIASFISSHTTSKTNSPESAATSLSSSAIVSPPSSEFSGESFELLSEGEEEEDEKENISDLPSTSSGAGSTSDVSGVLRGEIQRRRSSVFGGAGSSVDMGRFVKEVGNDVRRRSSVFGGGHQTE